MRRTADPEPHDKQGCAGELFARGNRAPAAGDAQKVIDDLHRKIGQLQVERDFLAGQPPSPDF